MIVRWLPGPPPGRGHWWTVWRGIVVPVEIGPALIHRDNPHANLLIKTLGGLAWQLDTNAKDITHHAVLESPELPPLVEPESIETLIGRSSIGEGLRDIKERGIDAHAEDLAREMSRPRRKRR